MKQIKNKGVNIRPMIADDLPKVIDIQALAYGDYFLESADVIRERFTISPHTAWVAEIDDSVCAYLVGYLSMLGKINPLNAHFSPALYPDCFYLHDLAIAPYAQGEGIARQLCEAAIKASHLYKCNSLALISVQNSVSFWERNGFNRVENLSSTSAEFLKAYCVDQQEAVYMTQSLLAN